MEILERIFGSAAKVKIIRLFLFNPEKTFDVVEVSARAKVSISLARREILNLENAGFLRRASYTKEVRKQSNRKVSKAKKRASGFTLEHKFPHREPLESFLSGVNPFKHKDVIDRISKSGKLQLLIISGLFIKNPDSRLDLLIVGDHMKENSLKETISGIEAEIGKEIKYALFETSEFRYRVSMFDRLMRDILDYPHEKIVNKLGI